MMNDMNTIVRNYKYLGGFVWNEIRGRCFGSFFLQEVDLGCILGEV